MWPKYWSFSFSISPSNEYSGLISFRMDWLDLLAVQGSQESPPTPQFKSINSLVLSPCITPPTAPHCSNRRGPFPHSHLFLLIASQSSNSPHIRGSPELCGPTAGRASVCQGAGCKKRHAGEEPWNRQTGHPGKPCLWGSPASTPCQPSLEAPPPPHPTPILLACLHSKSCPHLCRPGLHPVPMLSRKLPPPHQAGPLPTGSREGGGRGICDPAFLPFACPQGQNSLPSGPFRAGSADCHWLKFGPGLLRPEREGHFKLGVQPYLSSNPGSATAS